MSNVKEFDHAIVKDPEIFQQVVEDPVIVVKHPLPDNGHCDGTGNDREIEDAAEEGTGPALHVIDRRRDQEGEEAGDRHGDQHDHQRVAQRSEKDIVMKQFDIVSEADEDILHIFTHGGVKKAGVDAHEHRINDKHQEKEQAGKHKQITGYGFPSDKSTAHAVLTFKHWPFLLIKNKKSEIRNSGRRLISHFKFLIFEFSFLEDIIIGILCQNTTFGIF